MALGAPRCAFLSVILTRCLLGSPAHAAEDSVQTAPVTRVSELTPALDEAWHASGYRLELQVGYESLPSWKRVPSGSGVRLGLGSGWQINSDWSVDVSMGYLLFLTDTGTLQGMRWSAAAGPSWHPWQGVRLGAALGFANMLANWAMPPDTFTPGAGFCDGPAAHGMVHAAYLLPLTEWFAMGPMLQAGLAYTQCTPMSPNGTSKETVPPWPQYDVAATWILSAR